MWLQVGRNRALSGGGCAVIWCYLVAGWALSGVLRWEVRRYLVLSGCKLGVFGRYLVGGVPLSGVIWLQVGRYRALSGGGCAIIWCYLIARWALSRVICWKVWMFGCNLGAIWRYLVGCVPFSGGVWLQFGGYPA